MNWNKVRAPLWQYETYCRTVCYISVTPFQVRGADSPFLRYVGEDWYKFCCGTGPRHHKKRYKM